MRGAEIQSRILQERDTVIESLVAVLDVVSRNSNKTDADDSH